jgi:hypothetical protein
VPEKIRLEITFLGGVAKKNKFGALKEFFLGETLTKVLSARKNSSRNHIPRRRGKKKIGALKDNVSPKKNWNFLNFFSGTFVVTVHPSSFELGCRNSTSINSSLCSSPIFDMFLEKTKLKDDGSNNTD